MIQFILNNKEVRTDQPPGMLLLDFIRYHKNLTGTKIGCREGDCGACTVLIGERKNDQLDYRSFTSCLTPLGNVQHKHVVTIEGINQGEGLNPIQQAMVDESATQCGFCTPGFVMSLAGFCLSRKEPTAQHAIAAIDGNICRCTGYKSIERAAERVVQLLQNRNGEDPATFVTQHQILPDYFSTISKRLKALSLESNGYAQAANGKPMPFVGGGTDLYVQKPEELHHATIQFLYDKPALNGITQQGNTCSIGPSATVADLGESPIIQQHFPNFHQYLRLVSSTPIRNMATLAGNFVNASPIGDFTILFLALDASLTLTDGQQSRVIPLRQFYKGYKVLDKQPQEYIEQIRFELPDANTQLHFEKVSKRTHLDIASVNSAIRITMQDTLMAEAGISAGGVAPVPTFLAQTSAFLQGKPVNADVLTEALAIAQAEISPISDARGTESYKRLLLNQLLKAHFLTLFPQLNLEWV